jgi:hypothetical protein
LQQSFTDILINAEVLLQADGSAAIAKVMQRCVDDEGRVVSNYNENPLLNAMMYECEFGDGTTKDYAANTIVTNEYMESDADGHSSLLLYHIIDHKGSGDATPMKDKYYVTATGTRCIRQTTKGWKLLVQWHNSSRQWIDLKILKEPNSVQVAEYATSCDIADHPACAWWVPYVLRKRDMIVSAVNLRVCKCSHNNGIEVSGSIKEALDFERKNGYTFLGRCPYQEMGNVCVAFEILGPNDKPPIGWYKASGDIVFDVKMDFTCKARWVNDRHKTLDSTTPSFAGIVSRESICVTLTYAALLGFPVIGADIQNAYLQAPSSEKHYIICGPEFGIENEGCVESFVCYMEAKLLEETSGTTSVIAWDIWGSSLLGVTPMFG